MRIGFAIARKAPSFRYATPLRSGTITALASSGARGVDRSRRQPFHEPAQALRRCSS